MGADLFGHVEPAKEFRDIRNTRESVADEKARLCLELNSLCRTPPPLAERSLDQCSSRVARRSQGCASSIAGEGFQPVRAVVRDKHHEGV
jgi:hypothetical protein